MQHTSVRQPDTGRTLYPILFAVSFVHLLNDTIQAVITAIFPILKDSLDLSYFQIGMIAFAINITASMMQPAVGLFTDLKPSPWLLPFGMVSTFIGVAGLALSPNFILVLISVVLIGIGSAVFHPEGSRLVHMAAGNRKGLAQSIYQVGGNSGQALAPVLTALIFVKSGQIGVLWFTTVAALAIAMQVVNAKWYGDRLAELPAKPRRKRAASANQATRTHKIGTALILLVLFIFARSWYHSAITNYYPFYLMDQYGISLKETQLFIFMFLAAGAVGTFLGGPLSDRFGKRNILLFSMLGSFPLALLLPYVNLAWAVALCLLIGFIVLSSFSVIVVYAQELMPDKIGMASGLTVGLAFGMGAVGSASLGGLADWLGIATIIKSASILPVFGLVALLLPNDHILRKWKEEINAGAK
ncbi:MAG TPA: MFS transporter [Bacilli bacterium]